MVFLWKSTKDTYLVMMQKWSLKKSKFFRRSLRTTINKIIKKYLNCKKKCKWVKKLVVKVI